VLTEDQQAAVGSAMAGSGGVSVLVNIENNTDSQVEKTQEEPRWNGEQWVVGVMLDKVSRNRTYKNNFKAALGI